MSSPAPQRALSALSGVVAAGVALGVGQFVAAFLDRAAGPLLAVGSATIDATPTPVREFAIDTFGTGDKTALIVGTCIVIAVIAAVAGSVERPRRPWGSVVFVAFGVLGVVAATTRAGAGVAWFLPTVVGVAAGIVVLRISVRRLADPTGPSVPGGATNRRTVLLGLSGAGIGAVVAGVVGSVLDHMLNDVGRDRSGFTVPRATASLDPPSADGDDPAGFITRPADFYRIDTALRPPQVTAEGWSLRIHGMVDREVRIDMDRLRSMPAVEKTVTLTCVSNEVGGDLIGTARWTGYRLRDLIAMAGPSSDADMVLSTSADGFTAGTPIEALTDDRGSLLAVGMDGAPLPVEHGYPARMVVPGLYGYVSATKWVVSLEVTRFDRATAYWTDRGWAEKGPIKTSSRTDVPRDGATVGRGRVQVAGVAWAQGRGIDRVQVRVDDGAWNTATVLAPDMLDAWRLWRWTWDAPPGAHTLTVRAFDGDGRQQSAVPAPPIPDGASGLHTISVTVT
ncbi:molybdopterin-dependent oxidoreductase [Williamsia deligens]|uniref:Molybdopterin-dependent oxidoreductase n=1 Tax=Williamsia deligens TaxID=321325 RepID=A0ABW3GEF8_9NOCA|nr:molybdopterin-dependent oxidoreductase [Williamsia deligens]